MASKSGNGFQDIRCGVGTHTVFLILLLSCLCSLELLGLFRAIRPSVLGYWLLESLSGSLRWDSTLSSRRGCQPVGRTNMSQRNKPLSSGWLFWKLVKVGAMYMTSNFQSLKWVYSKACVVTFPPCVLILQVESWGTKKDSTAQVQQFDL